MIHATSFPCSRRGPLSTSATATRGLWRVLVGFHFAVCSSANLVSEREVRGRRLRQHRAGTSRAPRAARSVGERRALPALAHGRRIAGIWAAARGARRRPYVGGNLATAGALQNPFVVRVGGDARIAAPCGPPASRRGAFTWPRGRVRAARGRPARPRAPTSSCRRPAAATVRARSTSAHAVRAAARETTTRASTSDPGQGLHLAEGGTRTLPCGRFTSTEYSRPVRSRCGRRSGRPLRR